MIRKQTGLVKRPHTMDYRKLSALSTCVGVFLASPSLILAADTPAKEARIDNARIFPFFATGGGWDSTITLINVFESDIDYRLTFRGINGQPALVTYRDNDSRLITTDRIQGRLSDDSSATVALLDTGATQTGWVLLEYDGESRIGGILTFRQRVAGRPDFESSVSLTSDDEPRVYLPFNNTLGYATTLAMTNPSTGENSTLQLRFWDATGGEIITRDIQLSAGATTAFSLSERYPELRGRSGQLRNTGSGSRLATVSLLFNPSGAFSTVPVMSR